MNANNNETTKTIFEVTPAALQAASELVRQRAEGEPKELRVYLDGKGCDGFYYGVTFDQKTSDDHADTYHNQNTVVTFICDNTSLNFLRGSQVDWIVHETLGAGFLVTNPQQAKFRGKFFKRPSWQQHWQKQKSSTILDSTSK